MERDDARKRGRRWKRETGEGTVKEARRQRERIVEEGRKIKRETQNIRETNREKERGIGQEVRRQQTT